MAEIAAQPKFQCSSVERPARTGHSFSMAEKRKKPPQKQRIGKPPQKRGPKPIREPNPDFANFLPQWREYRGGITQEELAHKAKMSVSNISQFERWLQGSSAKGLKRIADVLGCQPAHILLVNPLEDDEIWMLWGTADREQRKQIVRLGRAIIQQ